jgi:hypothetical protein
MGGRRLKQLIGLPKAIKAVKFALPQTEPDGVIS